jgi:O-phosphoseryl-tRNA(Cys) synthetase
MFAAAVVVGGRRTDSNVFAFAAAAILTGGATFAEQIISVLQNAAQKKSPCVILKLNHSQLADTVEIKETENMDKEPDCGVWKAVHSEAGKILCALLQDRPVELRRHDILVLENKLRVKATFSV